jgi:hypothetical protein
LGINVWREAARRLQMGATSTAAMLSTVRTSNWTERARDQSLQIFNSFRLAGGIKGLDSSTAIFLQSDRVRLVRDVRPEMKANDCMLVSS